MLTEIRYPQPRNSSTGADWDSTTKVKIQTKAEESRITTSITQTAALYSCLIQTVR